MNHTSDLQLQHMLVFACFWLLICALVKTSYVDVLSPSCISLNGWAFLSLPRHDRGTGWTQHPHLPISHASLQSLLGQQPVAAQ